MPDVKLNCRSCISKEGRITPDVNILESNPFCLGKWLLHLVAELTGLKSKESPAPVKV